MGLLSFWNAMTETGRLIVPLPGGLDEDDVGAAGDAIVAFEAEFRREVPGESPCFDASVAAWALT